MAEVSDRHELILKGVAFRQWQICLLFALAFGVYGFVSYEFIVAFDSSVTLWSNVWPRLLFNSIPFLLIGLVCRFYYGKPYVAYLGVVAVPVIFVSACFIHVWPLIYAGNSSIYPYVHGPNIFIISATLIATSGPLKVISLQMTLFTILFALPVALMLQPLDKMMFKIFVNDYVIVVAVSSLFSYSIYKLRVKLMEADARIQDQVRSFLGKPLTQALYAEDLAPYEARVHNGVILVMDIRGYTTLRKSLSKDDFRNFIKSYHRMVAQIVGKHGGYLLKSMGDGHLIFFGDFESPDLTDVPGLQGDVKLAETRALQRFSCEAKKCAQELFKQFNDLISNSSLNTKVHLGAAIDCGEIETMIIGDDQFRREFDMSGEVIIRCTRLEEFTKFLMRELVGKNSVLVLSPEVVDFIDSRDDLTRFNLIDYGQKIRDYPEIEFIYFSQFEPGTIMFEQNVG